MSYFIITVQSYFRDTGVFMTLLNGWTDYRQFRVFLSLNGPFSLLFVL